MQYHKENAHDLTLQTIGPGVSSSDATTTAGDMQPKTPVAFASGRRSLDRSVWYNGWLLTFLATGEETQGRFALIEAVGRRGNVPPPHIHRLEDEITYVLEGEIVFTVAGRTI